MLRRTWFPLMAIASLVWVTPVLAQKAIGEVQSSDATVRGSVVLAKTGTSVMSGAQISAGATTAVLKLTRGGEMQICPQSGVTISSSNSGLENLIGLSAGTIEAHYELASNADTVLTPDFRILLPGPGAFHFGFALEPGGDVCVKSLPGSTSSVIVSEMFGEGTHQVKPGEQFVFHAGRVVNASTNPNQSCACPLPPAPAIKTATAAGLGFPEQESQRAAAAAAAGNPLPAQAETAPTMPTEPGEIAMKVDAPMVFHSEDLPPSAATVPRSNLSEVQFPILESVQPPVPEVHAQKRWYQKVGSAFSRFFRGKPSS